MRVINQDILYLWRDIYSVVFEKRRTHWVFSCILKGSNRKATVLNFGWVLIVYFTENFIKHTVNKTHQSINQSKIDFFFFFGNHYQVLLLCVFKWIFITRRTWFVFCSCRKLVASSKKSSRIRVLIYYRSICQRF